jgi:hypothetical protein
MVPWGRLEVEISAPEAARVEEAEKRVKRERLEVEISAPEAARVEEVEKRVPWERLDVEISAPEAEKSVPRDSVISVQPRDLIYILGTDHAISSTPFPTSPSCT